MKIALVLFKYSVSIHDPCCYPLGFMYVSAWLKKLGHEVTVFNHNINQYCDDYSVFDNVHMTGFEEFLPKINELSAHCEKIGIKTTVGGALATFETSAMRELIDDVFVGEIENCSIENIPWPDYEGFGIAEYNKIHNINYMGIMTSRGCPFSCAFCAQTCSFNERSLDDVFAEIRHYKYTYNVETIVFNDNTLNIRKDRFLAICRFMSEQNITWSAAIRLDLMDEEMVVMAKESGCIYFVVGVESFNQAKLDSMNKRLQVCQITDTLDLLEKYGIKYHGNVLLGQEGDTIDSIMEEIEAIPKQYNIFPVLLQPFIGIKQKVGIAKEHVKFLNKIFRQYAEGSGMEMYKEV